MTAKDAARVPYPGNRTIGGGITAGNPAVEIARSRCNLPAVASIEDCDASPGSDWGLSPGIREQLAKEKESVMKITKTVKGIAIGTSLAAFVTLGVPATSHAKNLMGHGNQMVAKKK